MNCSTHSSSFPSGHTKFRIRVLSPKTVRISFVGHEITATGELSTRERERERERANKQKLTYSERVGAYIWHGSIEIRPSI